MWGHISAARGGKNNQPVVQAIRKYGFEAFKLEVLEIVEGDWDYAHTVLEPYWIKFCEAYTKGYCAAKGGPGIPGVKFSAETLKKKSVWMLNHPEQAPQAGHTKGTIYYTDGNKSIRLMPGDDIPRGFHPGYHWTPNRLGHWARKDAVRA